MASGTLAYKVEDRSLLLPHYRRFLVDPVLAWLPRSLSPNTITHVGHAINFIGTTVLIGLWPDRGWPFAFAALMLQAYIWCDNADGAHARRTGQCSPYGEFLDHGLDVLNVIYIGFLTAKSLGAPPLWWVLTALLIPGAASVTYWEQSQTGVFRLGRLNQLESGVVLSGALLVSAATGSSLWTLEVVPGVTVQLAMLAWALGTIVFGMVRSMMRVARAKDLAALAPVLVLIGFGAALAGAAALGAIGTVAAVTIATALHVFWGTRMLALRIRGELPRVDPAVLGAALVLLGVVAWHLDGRPIAPLSSAILAALACAVFGTLALRDARFGASRVARVSALD